MNAQEMYVDGVKLPAVARQLFILAENLTNEVLVYRPKKAFRHMVEILHDFRIDYDMIDTLEDQAAGVCSALQYVEKQNIDRTLAFCLDRVYEKVCSVAATAHVSATPVSDRVDVDQKSQESNRKTIIDDSPLDLSELKQFLIEQLREPEPLLPVIDIRTSLPRSFREGTLKIHASPLTDMSMDCFQDQIGPYCGTLIFFPSPFSRMPGHGGYRRSLSGFIQRAFAHDPSSRLMYDSVGAASIANAFNWLMNSGNVPGYNSSCSIRHVTPHQVISLYTSNIQRRVQVNKVGHHSTATYFNLRV